MIAPPLDLPHQEPKDGHLTEGRPGHTGLGVAGDLQRSNGDDFFLGKKW